MDIPKEQLTDQARAKLKEIFRKSNMADLPALSENVQELVYLSGSTNSSATQLAEVILKDYSLTNKILQVVNSAYYSRGVPVSSIGRAVTVLGFATIRELATAIAVFEDFIKAGADKEAISKLLTLSMLSAILAKSICVEKKLRVPCDVAFICSMLYRLGDITILVWMPDHYRKIEELVDSGRSVAEATQAVLDGLTFHIIGQVMVKFWNFSDTIAQTMTDSPFLPESEFDTECYLQNLTAFSNLYIDGLATGADLRTLLMEYGAVLSLNQKEAAALVEKGLEHAGDISKTYRYGISKLKLRSRLGRRR